MATSSETSVCNGALILLGADPIGSLGDEGDVPAVMNQFYSSTRDTVLQSYPWNFAVRRATLTKSAVAPDYQFAYKYILPNNPLCLRVLRAQRPNVVFRREGDFLLSDEGTMKIKFIAQITSVAEFSPMFREALEHMLAWKACYPVTGSTSLRNDLMKSYKEILEDAEEVDTQEGAYDPEEEYMQFNDLIDVRYSGSIGRSNR